MLVALRKESVDRNDAMQIVVVIVYASLSARRAWIEIMRQTCHRYENQVALRKESVDRNRPVLVYLTFLFRRSPQGERG